MPITSPSAVTSGPPELRDSPPRRNWMRLPRMARRVRAVTRAAGPEDHAADAEGPMPNGKPTATTSSPLQAVGRAHGGAKNRPGSSSPAAPRDRARRSPMDSASLRGRRKRSLDALRAAPPRAVREDDGRCRRSHPVPILPSAALAARIGFGFPPAWRRVRIDIRIRPRTCTDGGRIFS